MSDASELVFETRADGHRHLSVAPMLSLDPDGTVRFVNDAFLTLTGFDRGAVVGDGFASLRAGEEAQAQSFETVSPGESVARDVRLRCAEGGTVPVRLSGRPEVRNGSVDRIHCQLEPRAETPVTDDGSSAQTALLQTLLDGLRIGVLAETADRTVLAVNDELVSMFDLPRDRSDLLGEDCADLAVAASEEFVNPEGFVRGIQARVEEGEPATGELLERTDGRVFERGYRPIDLPGGRGHLWTYDDVTDEQARKSELETYERLVDVAPVGVFRTTTDGRVLTANQRMADILGYDSVAELLANYEDLAADLYVDPTRRRTFVDRLQGTGEVEDFEYEARVRDDGRRWLSMNARLLDETDDGARVITGFTWDVTDRRRHERQLAVLGRILRHNLRNALTVIKGQAELLGTETADSPDAAFERIVDRADDLLELADKEREIVNLLRGTPEQVTQDLCEIAESAREEVGEQHPAASITVSGPASAPVRVCLGFERAIRELVENAVLHAESEAPEVTVTITDDDDITEIAVRDRGPGIPDIERRVLAGQVDESPLYHSAGIGLFLVRQLVDFSEGALFFEENEPRGSVVSIRLRTADT